MTYLKKAFDKFFHLTMQGLYGDGIQNLQLLEDKFRNLMPDGGWSIAAYQEMGFPNAEHLRNQRDRNGSGNPYWDASLFGFPDPTNIKWDAIRNALGDHLWKAPLGKLNPEEKLRVVLELQKVLVTVPNVSLLLRFLCPEEFGVFAGYIIGEHFPINWGRANGNEIDFVSTAYLDFCEHLKILSRAHEMGSAANTDHALWTIYMINRPPRNPNDVITETMKSIVDEYFQDKMINDWRHRITPLSFYFRDKQLAPPQPQNKSSLLRLSEAYFPFSKRLCGKLARESLERGILTHAMKNFPRSAVRNAQFFHNDNGLTDAHTPVRDITARRPQPYGGAASIKFKGLLKIASGRVENPKRGQSIVFLDKNFEEIYKAYLIGNKAIHVNEVTSDEIYKLIKVAKAVEDLPL